VGSSAHSSRDPLPAGAASIGWKPRLEEMTVVTDQRATLAEYEAKLAEVKEYL
jgi:hypothetical protein